MITDVEDFFTKGCGRCARFATPDCSTRRWLAGILDLRRICRDEGLVEQVKWGHPCYLHAGRNIALIGALRNDFRLSFMNAALLNDHEGLLERRGPDTRHPDMMRFTDSGQVAETEPFIRAYLREAMGHAETGTRPTREVADIDIPEELADAMDIDAELADAFHALTPGRQRSYTINLNGAKTSSTRVARIARFRDRILAGKGANER
ncbi:MAG: YdeI/OmpD-associated family protein [Rhodobacteraceae bacterium]|nr:YdeI/OmpD-associated family protein [Paracoccaceae bacterium]